MSARFPLAVRAVVVDLDGTLLDTAPDIGRAANLMLRELGFPERAAEQVRNFVGKGVEVLIKRLINATLRREPDAQLLARAKLSFERHYMDVLTCDSRPFAGVIDGLKALKQSGFRLGCVTNKLERFTLPLLAGTGLKSWFELIVSGDSLPKKKPDPMPLLHACAQFGIGARELLLVGDSVNDTLAARAAGCHVFCVPYGYNEGRDVRELDCDAIVETLADVPRLINFAATVQP